ncbi:MAG: SDR family NAD(P)-dependent oxidoreductase [Planctomycetota bacterium]|jgi:3-oxoacyl-[acyl-carrier protein] reductase
MSTGSELEGRTAIVTGGAQGIGRAICRRLAEEGADVVVADLNEPCARETVEIVEGLGRRSAFVATDVSSEESVKALYAKVLGEFGTVDVLVNNAGLCRMVPILDIEVEEWDRILAVNLRGTFLMSREAFRIMKEVGRGRIVSIASAAAKIGGLAAGAHYSASKAGVICFTKSLALQAAPYKINVNAVCPGPIATEMTDAWGEETNTAFAAKIPWQEYGRPEDIANAVAFLASDRARYMTGEIVDVNGGLVMD